MSASPAGDFLSSFSTSYTKQKDYQRQKAELAAGEAARRDDMFAGAYAGPQGDSQPYSPSGPSASAGRSTPMTDPASSNMPSYQLAFLNAIADGESNGAYDVRYTPQGGTRFDPANGHPRTFEATNDGRKSSAAGRYQFTWTTWKGLAGEDTPFTPENQDHYAWKLAVQDYNRNTGRDLSADLQSGMPVDQVMSELGGTWRAFTNRSALPNYARTYADSLARYQTPAAPVQRSIPPLGFALGTPQ